MIGSDSVPARQCRDLLGGSEMQLESLNYSEVP